ncbi:hypothetical protein TNCV_4132721 [Trichonephila clavipes]|nr:hypothetical protein TNCV_4132721 [Trichonephila clavipes]
MTNHYRTWGRKPRLVSKNRYNRSRREDDKSDEESDQTSAGIGSAMINKFDEAQWLSGSHRASTPQVRGSNLELGKGLSELMPYQLYFLFGFDSSFSERRIPRLLETKRRRACKPFGTHRPWWPSGQGIGSWLALSSPVPLKTRRVGQRFCREFKRPPVGVVVRRGGSSGVIHVT